jgi:hypothetical protein
VRTLANNINSNKQLPTEPTATYHTPPPTQCRLTSSGEDEHTAERTRKEVEREQVRRPQRGYGAHRRHRRQGFRPISLTTQTSSQDVDGRWKHRRRRSEPSHARLAAATDTAAGPMPARGRCGSPATAAAGPPIVDWKSTKEQGHGILPSRSPAVTVEAAAADPGGRESGSGGRRVGFITPGENPSPWVDGWIP